MSVDRTSSINEQPYFFRNNYRRLITTAFVLLSLIFILIGIIFYQYYSRPAVHYFVTTSDGRLIEIHPG
jgi:hypothetical protein